MSAYLRIAEHELGCSSLSAVAAGLPSLVKYGVPTLQASWAMAAGVASRKAAIHLSSLYAMEDPTPSPARLRRWLGDLNPEELLEEYGVPLSAVSDLSRALLRVRQSSALTRLDEGEPLFPISTSFRAYRRAQNAAAGLLNSEILELQRDYDSPHRNATLVSHQGNTLGYLRRTDAQVVAPELDAGAVLTCHLSQIEFGTEQRWLVSIQIRESSN